LHLILITPLISDYAKAFDSVVHPKLLAKLACYGINEKLITWIESFLTGRSEYVKIVGYNSPTYFVTSGVPQDSVLGPVLFIVFVNHICDVVPVTVKLLIENTKLDSVIKNTVDRNNLQSFLNKITWFFL